MFKEKFIDTLEYKQNTKILFYILIINNTSSSLYNIYFYLEIILSKSYNFLMNIY